MIVESRTSAIIGSERHPRSQVESVLSRSRFRLSIGHIQQILHIITKGLLQNAHSNIVWNSVTK